MLRKMILTTILVLIIAFSIQSTFYPVHADNSVKVLSSSGWVDSIGFYHISGEIQNTGTTTIDSVKISATFYDANNSVLDTGLALSPLYTLLPSVKSPFEILDTQTAIVPKFDHYELSVTYKSGGSIEQNLRILSSNSYMDTIGKLHVVGEIQNVDTISTSDTVIWATFYDSVGMVVYTDFWIPSPASIAPGNKSAFAITVYDSSRIPLFASYSLTGIATLLGGYPAISTNSSTSLFYILPSPTPTPILNVNLSESASALYYGNKINFTVLADGGTKPYNFAWYIDGQMAQTSDSQYYSTNSQTVGNHHVYVQVTDANNNSATPLTVEFNVLPMSSNSPGISPTPSPSIPEFPTSIILPLIVAAFMLAVLVAIRKRSK